MADDTNYAWSLSPHGSAEPTDKLNVDRLVITRHGLSNRDHGQRQLGARGLQLADVPPGE